MLSALYWAAYVQSEPTKQQIASFVRYNARDANATLKGPQ